MAKRQGIGVAIVVMMVALVLGGAPARAEGPSATLITYSTVEDLLSGGLLRSVTMDEVIAALAPFPADWPVVGMGTTDWVRRNGELIVDGTAGDPNFLWADPGYDTAVGRIVDLETAAQPEGQFPFLGVAVVDPATALTWTVSDVPDLHAWLETELAASGIDLAAIQVHGDFAAVQTSDAYNIPLTGLDLSGGYVGDDFFRYGDYVTSTWVIEGMYAAAPELQPVVSTAGHPLHLHGYQPADRIGGHIQHAAAIRATVVAWPVSDVRTGDVQADTARVLVDLAAAEGATDAHVATLAMAAVLLEERGADTTVDEASRCVVGRMAGAGPGIGLVTSFSPQPLDAEPASGDAAVSTLPDEHTGAAIVLDMVRRFSALPEEERPALTVVGFPDDDEADISASPCLDALDDTTLSVLVAPSFSVVTATAGIGPVIVWGGDDVPDWADDFVATGAAAAGLSAARQDVAGLDAPVILVSPALSSTADGDTVMAADDVEAAERLLIDLLNDPGAREDEPPA